MGIPDRAPAPTGYPGSAPVPNGLNNPNTPNGPNNPNNPVPDWMRPLMPTDGSGQPQRPPVSGPGGPASGPSGFGMPAGQRGPGYAAPQSGPSDVNPWSLEPGEPLEDADLPEWLRQPNQE